MLVDTSRKFKPLRPLRAICLSMLAARLIA
jgi:hypothetical protein